ncbi:MAG: SDR family NAD(P)-dependent oxidoreductase [Peptostreptococcales bacterium]
MRIAIITGASSGLGRAFAIQIAKTREVDELWVIARREERLRELASNIPIAVRPLAFDLGHTGSIKEIERLLDEEKPDVRYLVNAAGFGKFGNYNDLTHEESLGMLDINVRALINITLSVLPYMSRGGRLLQIASTSAFQPLPGFNIYAATKAFIVSYTKSLKWELFNRGIHVTAVCPGWIKTEFMQIAIDSKNGNLVKHFWLALSPTWVARWALLGNKLGFAVVTCAPHNFIHRIFAKILPSWLIISLWRILR